MQKKLYYIKIMCQWYDGKTATITRQFKISEFAPNVLTTSDWSYIVKQNLVGIDAVVSDVTIYPSTVKCCITIKLSTAEVIMYQNTILGTSYYTEAEKHANGTDRLTTCNFLLTCRLHAS